MKLGLLLESAQAHQNLAHRSIEMLDERVRDLDGVIRTEVRQALIEELQEMHLEISRATHAMRRFGRSINFRFGAAGAALLLLAVGIPAVLFWRAVPDRGEIDALRTQRDALSANIVRLERRGGRLEWRLCGERSAPCVQIDNSQPPFGEHSDFRIVKGH